MSLKTQAIVTAWGNSTRLIFNHPLRIHNKIALKSLYYPKYTVPTKFSLYLKDEVGEIFNIPIIWEGIFKNSGEVSWAIFEALWDYCEYSGRVKPEIIEWDEFLYGLDGVPLSNDLGYYDYIILDHTGLTIISDDLHGLLYRFGRKINIFSLFERETVENTGTNFKVNYHEVNHDYLENIPVAIHCNVIMGTYIDSKPQQILEVLYMDSKKGVNVIDIERPTFHSVIVDEIFVLELKIITLDGENLEFEFKDTPVIFKLIFE